MTCKNYILFGILVICIASCSTPITPDIESSGSKMVVDADLEPGQRFEVFLTTTAPLFTESSSHFYPVGPNANILLNDKRISYSQERPGLYTSAVVQIEEGETYTLTAEFSEDLQEELGVTAIESTTTVPLATEISDVQELSRSIVEQEDGTVDVTLELRMHIDEQSTNNIYHQLISEFYESNGDPRIDVSNANVLLLNENINSQEFTHKNGIFIDYNNTSSPQLDFRISFKANSIDNLPDTVKLILRTTSEEYFTYHETLSRQLSISSSPNVEPVSDYTNINNGWGIFGAVSSRDVSIDL